MPKLPIEPLLFADSAHRQRCIGALSQVVEFGLRHPEHLADRPFAKVLEDDCIDALLTHLGPDSARPKETPSRRYQALRCAVRYLRDHPAEPVSLRQLCKVTGVSDRALETAFKETFNLTPKAYITLTRLHGVRRTLSEAGPAETNVTEIATRWGFLHLGRFAQNYRELFGESPSITLQRRSKRQTHISIP
jgi:AraC family ethanolamine operon transcriptional activator